MTVGIVVIGRNEGARLTRCLDALSAGAYPIVYVDSGSSDDSVSEAEKRGAHVVRLDMTRPFNAGRARNEGFTALKALVPSVAFVQFIDGDCEIAPGWIASALSFFDGHPDVAIVCGRRRERSPEVSIYNRLCDIEWNTPVGEAAACGGDSLVRVTPLSDVGGFSSHLIAGEEPELCSRLRNAGWKIWRIDAAMTAHDADMHRFGQWWARGVRSGFGYAQVWSVTRRTPLPLYGKNLVRAVIWAGLIPGIIIAMAFWWLGAALVVAGAYPLQVARIALRRGGGDPFSWAYGLFTVLAKFPELQGAVRFWRRTGHRAPSAIEYK